MAKRFTATEKWIDTWFCNLKPKHKLLWIYMLDNCDISGVWEANLKLAGQHAAAKYDPDEVRQIFAGKVFNVPGREDKWFIPNFIDFQYGELKPSVNLHSKILKMLDLYQIPYPYNIPPEGLHGSPKDKDKDKEEDKDKKIEKTNFPQELDTPEFQSAWAMFLEHRRQIKKYMTPLAASMSIKKLMSLSGGNPVVAVQIIEQSVANGWQGLFELKNGSAPKKPLPAKKMEYCSIHRLKHREILCPKCFTRTTADA